MDKYDFSDLMADDGYFDPVYELMLLDEEALQGAEEDDTQGW